MKLLITGASGFIGRNVLKVVPERWKVRALYGYPSGDLSDPVAVQDLAKEGPWDCILHLAARVEVPASIKQPDLDCRDNQFTTLNVARYLKCKHLVYVSSGAVYEGHVGNVTPASPCHPSLPYAVHKLAGECYARAAVWRFKTAERATIVRFWGAYGPYEPSYKLIHRLVKAFGTEKQMAFGLVGDGLNFIDPMWAEDAADLLLRLCEYRHPQHDVWITDMAGGEPMFVSDFAILVSRLLMGRDPELSLFGDTSEAHRFAAKPEVLWRRLGWQPKVRLKEGIPMYRDYLLAQGARPSPGIPSYA